MLHHAICSQRAAKAKANRKKLYETQAATEFSTRASRSISLKVVVVVVLVVVVVVLVVVIYSKYVLIRAYLPIQYSI